jgi:putative zinc finger/helix-turn-helix YgiT family protein
MQCARCEKEIAPEPLKGQEIIVIRKEPITVDVEYYKCSECGEEFLILSSDKDPFKIAYEKYRAKHKMLQPAQIKNWRRKYGLTQDQVAKLLGIGVATLSRYESGKLQDEAHDTMLRLAMEPTNLQRLVADSADVFSEEQKKGMLESIKKEAAEELSLEHWITVNVSCYDPDEYSGFKKFDLDKFYNAVLYFCKDGALKTKLNKLLFYADFKHFKDYTVSITGARYARIPFGPAPDNYDLYYHVLVGREAIEVEEKEYPGYTGENIVTVQEPDLNLFSESELRILATIKEHFKNYNSTEISSFSHGEKGYKGTLQGKIISYRYASQLKL